MKNKVCKIAFGIFVLLVGYILGKSTSFSNNASDFEKDTKSEEIKSAPQLYSKYTVDIPSKYFDAEFEESVNNTKILKFLFISDLPKQIENPDLNGNVKEIFKMPESSMIRKDEIKSEYFDVDQDGNKERILYLPNINGAHGGATDFWIIKDGLVIYKTGEILSPRFEASSSNNGFYITMFSQNFPAQPSYGVTTRYYYENGKFIPVWEQKFHELLTIE